MYRASSYDMYINQQYAQDSCNYTLLFIFQLNALHVSDCISPPTGATLSCTSHLVYAGAIRLAVVWL